MFLSLRFWKVILLMVVGGLGVSCKKEPPSETPSTRPRLVSPEEIQSFEKQQLAEIEKIKNRECPRPVLRGKAEAGSAAEHIIALVEGTPEFEVCRGLLETHNDLLRDNLLHPESEAPPGVPRRNMQTAREITKPGKELRALDDACIKIVSLIQSAVRHQNACSPYRPGLRGQPNYISMIRTVRYAAYRARALCGRAGESFDLLMDSLRFCQDFCRGGTSVLETMIAVGATRAVLPMIEHSLNRIDPLDEKILARVESELGQLIKTQPHPATFLRGEIQTMSLYTFLPGIKGSGWTPPGGWGKDTSPNDLTFSAAEYGMDDVESNALAYIAMQETRREWLQGCKESELPVKCYLHMEKLGQDLKKTANPDPGSISGMLKYALADDKAKELRRQIVQILKSIASPAFDKYVAREGQVRFTLAALRLHAAYRRLAEQVKACPNVAVFDKSPLWELRTDPYSGGQIKVESTGPGLLVLRSPVPLGKQGGEDAEPAVFVRCPYGK